jgi:putative transposase
MKRARFTEEQIIGVLKEHKAGAKTADLARKHGVSEATLYNWKAKYGGMDTSEAKRLKQLEDENAKRRGSWPSRWLRRLELCCKPEEQALTAERCRNHDSDRQCVRRPVERNRHARCPAHIKGACERGECGYGLGVVPHV